MCSTSWCYGDCDECLADAKWEKEQEELNAECSYRKECNWVVVDTKNDRCTKCGDTFVYP